MLDPQTLRGRLTLSYALALVVSLAFFGALALAVVDHAQRTALDAQLTTSARAILATVESQHGRVTLDEADSVQLSDILGAKANGVVWQQDGQVAASAGRGTLPGLRKLALAATQARIASLRAGNEDVRAYVAPILSRSTRIGELAIWRETDTITELDKVLALAFGFAIPVLAALAVLSGSAIARRALTPLGRIATLASEIEASDLSARLALPSSRDELGRLAATFDRMLERLQNAFERERRFTGDASHELRAPLSVIRAEADLALRRERSGDEYREALRTIAERADALEAITRDLLGAARAEAESGGNAIVHLDAIAREAAALMAVLAAKRGLTITVSADEDARVRAGRDALSRAVVAVLHNALKYARDGGYVRLDVVRDGTFVELRVTDDGTGFSADALEHGFDRFWRGVDARTLDGSGLGLAIARSIVLASGGSVALANAPDGGAVVRIRFPAVSRGGDAPCLHQDRLR
ncbi:MAG: HAMP domain-containing histidine kinase [Candidatus Eremiobacteraeota bacterium]|nr:HAMP domain-containing histidine kinase [Candidatus Eremiobacteraeota bacterium]